MIRDESPPLHDNYVGEMRVSIRLLPAFYRASPVNQRWGCGITWGGLDLLSSTLIIWHDQNNPPPHDDNEGVAPSSWQTISLPVQQVEPIILSLMVYCCTSPPPVSSLDRFTPISVFDVGKQTLDPSLSDPFPLIDIVDVGRQLDRSIEAIEHMFDASTKHDTTINSVGWPLPPHPWDRK